MSEENDRTIVRVKPSRRGGIAHVYHTDPDCAAWPENGWDRPLDDLEDVRQCKRCSGDVGGNANNDFSYQHALKAAAKDADDERSARQD